MGMSLVTAALCAPLIGVRKRWPSVKHAVDLDSVVQGWDRGTFESACGLTGLRLLGGIYEGHADQGLLAIEWPPRVATMPAGSSRCRDCWVATGKQRPRSAWGAA